MVSIKKGLHGRRQAVVGISLEKKMKIGKGNKSEEHRHEFMLRMHGNLWAANWKDGIGIEVKRWETEMER